MNTFLQTYNEQMLVHSTFGKFQTNCYSYNSIFAEMEAQKTSYPKEKIRILFLENISDTAVKNFRSNEYTNVEKITKALTEDDLVKEIKDVHILGIRSKTQITKKVLDAAKKLQAIGCFCIGVNQVDLKAATKNGVVVFNAPYSNTRSFVIIYARGELVELYILRKAIIDGTICVAVVDVFLKEPQKNGDKLQTPLQDLPNVILTPHIGGSTEEAQENIGEDVSNKLV